MHLFNGLNNSNSTFLSSDGYCVFHYNKLVLNVDESKEKCKHPLKIGNGNCKKNAVTDGYCGFHYNKLKPAKNIIIHDGPTKICGSAKHDSSHSLYDKNKVPIEKFMKKNKPITDLRKYCEDCMNHKKKEVLKRKESFMKISDNTSDEFLICPGIRHVGVSPVPRNKVPKEMFMKNPKDPKSVICEVCADCRIYDAKAVRKSTTKLKNEGEKNGKFYCIYCKNIKPVEERKINLDDTNSSYCISCAENLKIYNKKNYIKRKNVFREVQYEEMVKIGSSCESCNSIFLLPKDGTKYVVELKTISKNNELTVDYDGKEYLTKDFLVEYKELLEFRILDFDHLSENELRERGKLKPDEEYLGKKDSVSNLQSEFQIRQEDKLRKSGCSECGFYDETLLSFLEFDHLDPKTKLYTITELVGDPDFTIDDIKKEILKTRILCRFCHRIHTSEQRKEGII